MEADLRPSVYNRGIEFGYKLPFIHIPAPKVSRNNRSALTGKLNGPPEI